MKNKVKFCIIAIAVLIVSGLHGYGTWEQAIYDTDVGSASYETIGEIHNNFKVQQEFYCENNGLSGFRIRMATYDREELQSELNYIVKEKDTEAVVAEGMIHTAALVNNDFNQVSFDKIDESADKSYILEIYDDNVPEGESVTIFKTKAGASSGAMDYRGKEDAEQEEALVMKVLTHRFNLEEFIVFAGIIMYIGLFLKLLNRFLR